MPASPETQANSPNMAQGLWKFPLFSRFLECVSKSAN